MLAKTETCERREYGLFQQNERGFIKNFYSNRTNSANIEERLNPVKPKDVEDYLKALKKENKDITIYDLCENFRIYDDFKMQIIIGELEKTGKAFLNGFTPVYREDGGLIYLARYTGAD